MKEIKDWEAIEEIEDGKKVHAIPLPGCYILGKIDGKDILLKTDFVDLNKLIIRDIRRKFLFPRWSKAFLFRGFRKLY